MLVKETINSRW